MRPGPAPSRRTFEPPTPLAPRPPPLRSLFPPIAPRFSSPFWSELPVHIIANFSPPPTLAIRKGKAPDRSEKTAPRHFLRPILFGLPLCALGGEIYASRILSIL